MSCASYYNDFHPFFCLSSHLLLCLLTFSTFPLSPPFLPSSLFLFSTFLKSSSFLPSLSSSLSLLSSRLSHTPNSEFLQHYFCQPVTHQNPPPASPLPALLLPPLSFPLLSSLPLSSSLALTALLLPPSPSSVLLPPSF